jgi:hypothetical protein
LRVKAAAIGFIAVIALCVWAGIAAADTNALHTGINGGAEQTVVAAGGLVLPETFAISAYVGRARIAVATLAICVAAGAGYTIKKIGALESDVALATSCLRRCYGAGAMSSAVDTCAGIGRSCALIGIPLFVRSTVLVGDETSSPASIRKHREHKQNGTALDPHSTANRSPP